MTRTAVLVLLAACGAPAAPVPVAAPAAAHVHGMLVFGRTATHFSHLPLFHEPHDYQAILTVRLPDDARAALDADAGVLHTFAPEPFVLDRAAAPGFMMRGTLYHGHFERGGTPLVRDVDATVERVVHFRRFEPGAAPDPALTYLVVGAADDAYLVHHLTAPPDFDHVVEVTALPAGVEPGALVRFPDTSGPLAAGGRANAELEGTSRTLELGGELYLERDELSD